MIRHRFAVVGLVGASVLGLMFVRGNAEQQVPRKADEQQAALMRAKLASTQKIVEGLVSKEFDDITRGAEELMKICKANEWKAHSDEVYSHHRRELMRQAEKIINASARENLDGAAYSYIHALTTCISCHDYCRDVLKIADADTGSRVVPIPTTEDDMSRTIRR